MENSITLAESLKGTSKTSHSTLDRDFVDSMRNSSKSVEELFKLNAENITSGEKSRDLSVESKLEKAQKDTKLEQRYVKFGRMN